MILSKGGIPTNGLPVTHQLQSALKADPSPSSTPCFGPLGDREQLDGHCLNMLATETMNYTSSPGHYEPCGQRIGTLAFRPSSNGFDGKLNLGVSKFSTRSLSSGRDKMGLDTTILEQKFARLGFNISHELPRIRIGGQPMYGEDEEDDDDDEDIVHCRGPLMRSTSLKTRISITDRKRSLGNLERVRKGSILRQRSCFAESHSPTGEKKNVRFADDIGKTLENVKYYLPSPTVPRRHSYTGMHALYNGQHNAWTQTDFNVHIGGNVNGLSAGRAKTVKTNLVPANFSQPSLHIGFNDRLNWQSVLLHSLTTSETTIYGTISVRNLTFSKKVTVRYTLNDWLTNVEQEATYLQGSNEGNSDKFSFKIFARPSDFMLALPNTFHPRIFFAIKYTTEDGRQFWDNNNEKNYCLNYATF